MHERRAVVLDGFPIGGGPAESQGGAPNRVAALHSLAESGLPLPPLVARQEDAAMASMPHCR